MPKKTAAVREKTAKKKELVLEQLKKTPITQVVCEKVGIARCTFYRWCNEDTEFKAEVERARSIGYGLINDLAESQLVKKIHEGNMTAILFWLKTHHAKYKTGLELNAYFGKNSELNKEQKTVVRKALKLAQSVLVRPKPKGKKAETSQEHSNVKNDISPPNT